MVLRMSRPSFAGSYLLVTWWTYSQKNRMENGIELYVSLIVVRANKPQTNCSQSQEDLLYALDCFLMFAC